MKFSVLAPLVLLLITSCNSADTSESTENTREMIQQEEQKIKSLLMEYEKSLNTSNAKLAQSLYTEDGIFMPTEAPSGIGSEGILKSYEYVFSQIQLNINFSIEEIRVEGTMAFAVTKSEGSTLIHATGDLIPEANRELFVFQKVNEDWKISRYMFNKTAPKG